MAQLISMVTVLLSFFACWVLLHCLRPALSAPLSNSDQVVHQGQIQTCGDRLANMMYLVCAGRGYNVAFRGGASARRVRRGIVEECCYNSCSPKMLELYCRADSSEIQENVQIRKRSNSGAASSEQHQMEDGAEFTTAETDAQKLVTVENKLPSITTPKATIIDKSESSYKIINLLSSGEHSAQKENINNKLKKVKSNDTTEDDFNKQSKIPLLRHHKNHHRSTRPLRGHKASNKNKREKSASSESTQTFQIGTVKPYFAGRAFASYRSNYVHHSSHT